MTYYLRHQEVPNLRRTQIKSNYNLNVKRPEVTVKE